MKKNFWEKLRARRKPILAMAPLAGYTDSVFRQIVVSFGADVVYSEMASAAAIFYNQDNKENETMALLRHNKRKERYYVVQLFGSEPEHFAAAARFVTKEVRPDGIDINLGCPVPKVAKQGAGSGLMKDIDRTKQAVEAVLANTDLPVSIKIRTKCGGVGAIELLDAISDLPISAVMIHGRTLSQGFIGESDWPLVKEARKHFKGVILANGGITDVASAKAALEESAADGVALGRGALGRPWLFKEIRKEHPLDMGQRKIFKLAFKHAKEEHEQKGEAGILEFRKHLVWYLAGMQNASRLREGAVKIERLDDVKRLFNI